MSARHVSFKWNLLLCCCSAAVAQATFPATLEVDLIFPRDNATYAPTVLTPIVFAVQNPQLAGPLDLSLEYVVYYLGGSRGNVTTALASGFDLRNTNFSGSNPYFAYTATNFFNATEGHWKLVWSLYSGNCSESSASSWGHAGVLGQSNGIFFDTKNGGQQPDLVALTADDTCATAEGLTLNVTGTLAWDPSLYDGHNSCAVLSSPSPTPAANPCAVKVDSSIASSISAAITATECTGIHRLHPAVACPPTSTTPSAGARSRAGFEWLLVACWLGLLFLLL